MCLYNQSVISDIADLKYSSLTKITCDDDCNGIDNHRKVSQAIKAKSNEILWIDNRVDQSKSRRKEQ